MDTRLTPHPATPGRLIDRPVVAEEILTPTILDLYGFRSGPLDGLLRRADWTGLRYLIYGRLSDNVDGLAKSTTNQVDISRAAVDGRGGTKVDELVDDDISASRYSSKPRPAFDQAIALVEAGAVDVLVAYDLDRLWRDLSEFAWLCDFARENVNRLAIVTLNGDYDLSSSDGRFRATMMVAVAVMESEKTSRRVRLANASRARAGLPRKGGRRAFGWRDDGKPDEVEAPLLDKAWADILAGVPVYGVAVEWEALGVQSVMERARRERWEREGGDYTPKPTPWRRQAGSLRRILTNRRHCGDVVYRTEVVRPGALDAIIDPATLDAVTALIEKRSKLAGGAGVPRGRTAFSGLLRCARHDVPVTMFRGTAGGLSVYRCETCRSSITAKPVEARIEAFVQRVVDTPELVAALRRSGSDEDSIWAEVTAINADAAMHLDMLKTHEVDRAGYANLKRYTDERLRVARSKLGRRHQEDKLRAWLSDADKLGPIADLPTDVKRLVIRAAVDHVVIRPARRRGRVFDNWRVKIEPVVAAFNADGADAVEDAG